MKSQKSAVVLSIFVVALFFDASNLFSANLSVRITSPQNKARFETCRDIVVTAEAAVDSGEVDRVYFFRTSGGLGYDKTAPYEVTWEKADYGIYKIWAKAKDKNRNVAYSDTIIVYVGNVRDGNLLLNGEFSCSKRPWQLALYEGGQATFDIVSDPQLSDDTTTALIEIQDLGSVDWSVQLMQVFSLKSGHTYEISFIADVIDEKQIRVAFQQNLPPYEQYWYEELTVSEYNIFGPFEFMCTKDDPSANFKFILSLDDKPIYLDAIEVVDLNWSAVETKQPVVAEDYRLFPNYPNPFNPETNIKYKIAKSQNVKLTIYNLLGEHIAMLVDEIQPPGVHVAHWDGRDEDGRPATSGVYLFRITSGNFVASQKMVLLK